MHLFDEIVDFTPQNRAQEMFTRYQKLCFIKPDGKVVVVELLNSSYYINAEIVNLVS